MQTLLDVSSLAALPVSAPLATDSLITPLAPPEAIVTPTPIARPPRQVNLTFDPELPPILVAEDDEDDTYFIQRLIKKTGAKNPVRVFDDGSEVVNFLGSVRRDAGPVRHRPPLLLFLDLNMRGLGGFGFLEWARQQQKALAPLTIVILSNSDCPEDMNRARELGAHRYLVKYPSAQTFASIVRSVYPQTVF
jgi:CheY-like chemotaxis protein